MATAPNPTRRAQRRGLKITAHGVEHILWFGDLTPVDATDVRKQTGVALQSLLSSEPDIDTVAVLLWLARRKAGERHLQFSDAAEAVTYDAITTGTVVLAELTDEDDDPEA